MRLVSQRLRFLAGLLLLLAGLEILVTLTYMARWVGLALMLFGLGILLLTAKKEPEPKEEEKAAVEGKREEKSTLAEILINALTLNGKISIMLPIIGILLVVLVFAFNLIRYGNLELGVNDSITILLGIILIFYNYVPRKFGTERDFVLLFFIFLFLILVLPLTLYSLFSGPIQENSNSPFIYSLLARPTSDMLNFIGIPSTVHTVPPMQWVNGVQLAMGGIHIVYQNLGNGGAESWSSVGIGLSCTGLYSVSIFISGFIAFIMIEYRRFDIRVASLLTLGVFTCWFANILRMTIIIAVGSYYGSEALKWTHANLGIFLFMIWIGIFWGLMFKLLVPKGVEDGEEFEEGEGKIEEDKPEVEQALMGEEEGSEEPIKEDDEKASEEHIKEDDDKVSEEPTKEDDEKASEEHLKEDEEEHSPSDSDTLEG